MSERLLSPSTRRAGWILSLALLAGGAATAAERAAVGAPVPGFVLPATDGTTLDLASLRGRERAVVVFFRGSW
jgi:cytochrome oxidase Cu insertion factor (SCO1/SenC/PrrC family)